MSEIISISALKDIDSPSIILLKDRVQHNIDTAIAMIGDVTRLRPHIKTHKCAEVAEMMLAAGIKKFKCATIAEAEMLGQLGAENVLLAYQPVGPKAERFMALTQKYPATAWACLVDNEPVANHINQIFSTKNAVASVYIDLNVGMNRTGISPSEAIPLAQYCQRLPHIALKGWHAYDGHIREVNYEAKSALCDATYGLVEQLQQQLPLSEIVMGGSPSYSVHCKRPNITCSPGTFIYWDAGYAAICPEQPFEPAAFLLTRVISKPAPAVLCLDLGHKAVAAENPLQNRVRFINDVGLVPIGQSEEHLIVKNESNSHYEIGQEILAVPYHICPSIALHDAVYVFENHQPIGQWRNIARSRYLTI